MPLCGWAGAERFSLPAARSAGTPLHRQAGYCVADVKERPFTAYSPTTFLLWTSCGKEKSIWIGGCPTHPLKWHVKGFQRWLLALFSAGSEVKKEKKKSRKSGEKMLDVSVLPRLIRTKEFKGIAAWIRARTTASRGGFRHTEIVLNLAGLINTIYSA